MWVFDIGTLQFLDVNQAAIRKYGYSREEFLARTIADIRPAEDVPGLRDIVDARAIGFGEAVLSRHRLRSGDIINVLISGQTLEYQGRRARLICARDVTRLVQLEREREQTLERETAARRSSEVIAQRFQALFAAVPGKFLVLSPEGFEILAASDTYLQVTHNTREHLVGRRLFASFSQSQSRLAPDGQSRLRESLERVLATRRPDAMDVQAFPVETAEGGLQLRYWCAMNAPVLDAGGNVAYIFHKVEDVTELMHEGGVQPHEIPALLDTPATFELVLRTRELQNRALRLEAQVAELRSAQELLAMATWTLDLASGDIAVSGHFHKLLGTTPESFRPTLEGYLAMVHPADRDAMRSGLESFRTSGAPHFQIRQRIIRPDDARTLHVMVVGEFHPAAAGRVLSCIVQDVTAQSTAVQELSKMSALARLASRAARLGGWRFEVATGRLEWDVETFAIFGLPAGAAPDLATALGFYAPEGRARIREALDRCVATGEAYDELLQFVDARQRRLWVRTIGEAERDAEGRIVAVQGALQDVDEIVRARHEAEALSRRLTATLESISDAFFTLDREWHFTYLNSQAERLLNRDREALLGRVVWEEFPEAVGTAFQTGYERVMHEGVTARFDQDYPPLGVRFRVNAYPVPEGIAVYFTDITQQYRQESQLRLLQAAAERMNDVLLITEARPIDAPEGPRIVYVNEAFEKHTGFTREEALGRTPRILQGPKTQQDELARIRHALERWQPVRAELVNYTRSGEEIWLEVDIAPIADASGAYTHLVAVERDVTERRRSQELARVNDERFRLIAKATNDVVWDWDLVTGATWWNEGMRTLFGYPTEDLEPGVESWKKRVHAEDVDRVLASIRAAIEGNESTWSSEYRFMHADGRALTVVDRGFIIRDGSGRAVRMLGSMVDITERLELDAQLRQSQKLEAVGHLTGGVAHDFNNLLTVVLGTASLLGEAVADDPRLKEMAGMIEGAAQRGAELTQRMLAFSRRQALDPRVLDVNRLVADFEVMLRRTLPEDIELELRCAPDLWPAEVDPGQLEVALLNLVVNARDAMQGGGRLVIETGNVQLDSAYARQHIDAAPGPHVMVSVHDTGTGIAPQVMPQVFDPFFTTKEVGKGSGLGLSMVYGFMKQSRGHVSLASVQGQGTTVQLYFPRATAPLRPQQPLPEAHRPPGGAEHLLVVEDDELVRGAVVQLLQQLGYRVTPASSGEDALRLLPGLTDVALLFTDVVMPGMSGRELAQKVRELRPDIRILFTSGYAEDTIVHNGRLDPGVQLLPKPYRLKALAAKIRQVLDVQVA